MPTNAFIGKAAAPNDEELTQALGSRKKKLWDRIVTELNVLDREWKAYSKKSGWSLRLQKKKRNILYLSPCENALLASLIFGKRAFEEARSIVPNPEECPVYPEGVGVRLEIETAKDVDLIKKLVAIKTAS